MKKLFNVNSKVVSVLAIVLMVFLAASCNNMIDLGQEGSLAVSLPGGRSADGHLYTIEVASPTGATQTRTARGGQVVQFDGLSPNSYTVTVTGREFSDDDDEVGTVVLYGSNSATVVASHSASVAIDLINVVSTSTALGDAIKEGGTIYVYGEIDLSTTLTIAKDTTVTIKAAHKDVTISPTTVMSLFTVNDGGNLTLGGGEHTLILDGKNIALTRGISVSGGEATLKSNAIIQNCGEHAVSVGAGTFTLDGGTIMNNDGNQGAGVYTSGKFVMYSGSITGNTGNEGCGVYINGKNGGTFEMNGGSITGNTASGLGGGVYVDGKHASSNFTFNYTAGTISGNTTTSSVYDVYVVDKGVIKGTLPDETKVYQLVS